MCGRFVLDVTPEALKKEFNLKEGVEFQSYNIPPSEKVPIVIEEEGPQVRFMKWGFVPSWVKDYRRMPQPINARLETLTEKSPFRHVLTRRHCLVPANGFFEWRQENGQKQPYYIHLKDRPVFGMAGLWDSWTCEETGEILETFTIMTVPAVQSMKTIHDRLPLILKQENYKSWLNCLYKEDIPSFGKEQDAHQFEFYPVTKDVNNPKNNSRDCIHPHRGDG